MNPGITEEVGKQVGSFMDILRSQPLSLALVAMNLILLFFLFYSGSAQLTQRKETVALIVDWQREVGRLLANCISRETLEQLQKGTPK